MRQLFIRLDNKFVLKKGSKYYVTTVTKPKEWSNLTETQKDDRIDKEVTSKIKRLLRTHGSKSNMNFKTKPSKKKIRKQGKRTKRIVKDDLSPKHGGG